MNEIRPDAEAHPLPRRYGVFLLMLVATALVTRFQQFGNPIVHIDEQFYLLVGDRMLSGALPYVDIWDRKPIGLFLIYAAIRELGGSGIIQYQLVATGFAIGTAMIVERLAARLAGPRGSMLAGILYLLWIPLLTGQGGQSPVFYNLFVATAALCVCRASESRPSASRLLGFGLVAMLSTGIALQIKYSAIFEGIFFGLVLLVIGVRDGYRWRLLALAAAWIIAALLPTIAAGLGYWAAGHFAEYWFSNFVSIFQRHDLDKNDAWKNAASLSLYLAPLLILSAHGAKLRYRDRGRPSHFLTIWLAVALASVVFFGYYFDHYGLPVVLPAAVGAATALDRRAKRRWTTLVLAGALIACLLLPMRDQQLRGTPVEFARLTARVAPYAPQGLLVWDNLPILYYVLNTPLRTRYPFPTHLRDRNEVGAIGVDQPKELLRILAAHPAVIVIEQGKPRAMVRQTTAMLLQRLVQDYHRIASIKVGRRNQLVFLWNHAEPPATHL